MFKRAALLIITLAALCGAARAQSWTDEQRTLGAMYLTAHAIDWAQTRQIIREPGMWELNPILGRHPSRARVNAYFALTPLAGYLVLDALPSQHRTTALKVITTLEIATVARNHYIGVRIRF